MFNDKSNVTLRSRQNSSATPVDLKTFRSIERELNQLHTSSAYERVLRNKQWCVGIQQNAINCKHSTSAQQLVDRSEMIRVLCTKLLKWKAKESKTAIEIVFFLCPKETQLPHLLFLSPVYFKCSLQYRSTMSLSIL